MRLETIAFKNLARRKGKATLVVVGLAVGIATMVSIVTLMLAFEKSIDTQLDAYGFNIVIYPASSSLSLNYGGMNISGVDTFEIETLTEADIEKARRIRSADDIQAISPKVLQAIEVKKKKALLVGVDFTEEFQVKKWWKVMGHKPSSKDQVILGSDAAKNLRLKAGDSMKIGSQTFKVAGILHETGSQDDGLVFSDIKRVQALFGRGQELSLIEISAHRSDQIDNVVAELENALPGAEVSSIKQAVKYREEAMGSLARFGLMVTAIIIMISGFIVLVTMTSSVNERKQEIGVFRAMGYRKSSVARIILTEALAVSVVGGIVGYIVGFGATYALPQFVRSIELPVEASSSVFLLALAIAVLVGLVSSLMPARRAANMDPADALKSL
ncbi:MAG: ABC transporter permease [Actinomycetota bacterium]|nr:ABC transporter permease [Actinomycetota bacterium]